MLQLERLREALAYDPITGIFTWKVQTGRRIKVGDVAGHTTPRGYIIISIDGQRFMAHRLAWFYEHGEWPAGDLDHKNTFARGNNSIANLRPATRRQNNGNSRTPRTNTSGFKGVYWSRGAKKWAAQIRVASGRQKYLGLFERKEDAAAAYKTAAEREFGEFARG